MSVHRYGYDFLIYLQQYLVQYTRRILSTFRDTVSTVGPRLLGPHSAALRIAQWQSVPWVFNQAPAPASHAAVATTARRLLPVNVSPIICLEIAPFKQERFKMLQNTYSTAILRPVSNRAADAGTGYDIEFTGKDNDRAVGVTGVEPANLSLPKRAL